MYDLLKKLNTLVSAQVNDLASRLPSLERKPDLDRQVAELRQRVAAALEHEDSLRAQVATLQQDIAGLDARIDAAIQAGQEQTARALLDEVQRLQKRLAMAESDLRQHQNSAADLIIRVNELESAVGDLKSTHASAAPQSIPADAPKGSVTDFMPPIETPASAAQPAKASEPDAVPAAPVEAPAQPATAPEAEAQPTDTPPAEQAAPPETEAKEATDTAPAAEPEAPERKPWDQPRTAKEAAEWAREDAEAKSEQAKTGVEQVGGLLRDIQARVTQRMSDLDRMLQEGGLTDDAPAAPPAKPAPNAPASKPDDDLADRLSRLTKPE